MLEQKDFLERLGKLKAYADAKGIEVTQKEVLGFFEGVELSDEQTEMIFSYIKARKEEEPVLSEEEQQYLEEYKRGIPEEGTGPYLESYLGTVARIAVEYTGRGVTLEDLIQEGNMGLMTAMANIPEGCSQDDEKKHIETGIRKVLGAVLEDMEQAKVTDEKVVNQVSELVDRIKELTEELGYKPAVDEVSHYLDMKTEEIRRLLYLAGEEIEEETEDTAEEEEKAHVHGVDCKCGHGHSDQDGECKCGHDHSHHDHHGGCGCGHHSE